MFTRPVILSILLPLLLAACSEAPKRVTAQDALEPITIKRGQQLLVELSSNPTTGYAWAVTEMNTDILERQLSGTFTLGEGGEGSVGVGGTEVLAFLGKETGSTVLRIEYLRPFEAGGLPAQVIRFDVAVE